MDLTGKRAFVTGGTGGIGEGIAKALAAAGVDLAISYVDHRDGAEQTARTVEAAGRRCAIVHLDQRDPQSIETAADAVLRTLGGVDILVNNAAWNIGIPFKNIDALTLDVWNRMLETNLRGPFLLARALAPRLRAGGAGRIVNIASVGGLRPSSSSIAYSTSKAGLIHLTRCLAVALAPEITVNCIAPGLVEGTRIAERLPPAVAESARHQAVLGRTASIDDIAQQVIMFCRAESITGQVLVVDGGMPAAMH